MADNRNTLTDEILVLAETLGDIKARFERVESEFETQSKPLEAALAALSAAMTGIKTLQHHVLDNSLSALSLKVEEQRKAIDEQITVIVGELKGADAQNSEKIALQTAELKQQFSEISANVKQLASQFEGQLKRVELEAQDKLTKFAAVPGPQGPAGASINPRGNWIDGVTYNRLDVVSLLGTSYISAVDNNTSKPARNGDKWTVLARAGTGGGGAANFGSLAGVAEINQGGTGQTTALLGARALLDGISTTTGDILYRGSSGWTSLTAGAADTVLKSQGSGAAPQWAATSSATAATDAQAAAGTSTTTFVTPANAKYAAAPVVNARAPRQGLVFDGTKGADLTTLPAFGTSDFTVSTWVKYNAAATTYEDILGGAVNSLTIARNASGLIQVSKTGIAAIVYSTSTVPVGKFTLVTVTRSGNSWTVYFNGVSDNTATVSSDLTVGCSFIGCTVSLTTEPINGTILEPLVYNRALSASEVVALYEAGAPAGADYNSASNTSLSTSALTAFAPFTLYSTFSSANGTSFSASDASANRACATNASFSVSAGQKILVSFTLTQNGSDFPQVILCDPTGPTDSSNAVVSTAGANNITLTATRAGTVRVRFFSFAASNYSVANLSVTRLGLLLAPDAAQAGGGYVWNDQSGNLAQIVLPSSGVQWNLPSVAGQRIRGTTSTNGNQQLLGASVLLPAECQITHVRARARSGTPTITIGTASGGAQIVASVALSTTWLNCTIALTGGIVSSADDIWIGSNSTDVVETDIAFQPLDF